jgi:type IX secretion system PorP/SprF family membrane protein
MQMKRITLLSTVLACTALTAQDPEFSQFYAAPLYLNPAFAGTTYQPKFHLNFRDQWPGLNQAYVTMAVSYDQFFEDFKSGIGIQLLADRAGQGIYSTYTAVGVYSYQATISDQFALKMGIQAGVGQKRLDMSKVFFYDQINPVTGFYDPGNNVNPTSEPPNIYSSQLHGELGAGILAYSRVFYMGFAVRHINQPVETFRNDYTTRLPMHYGGHLGASIPLGGRRSGVTLSPNVLYTQQASFRQLNAGMSLKVGYVFGGAWLRHDLQNVDALILMAGTQFGIFKAGYSYDATLSGLRGHSGGAHELSITLNLDELPGARKGSSNKIFHCPALI